jgi:hypothetical protein
MSETDLDRVWDIMADISVTVALKLIAARMTGGSPTSAPTGR